MQRISGLDGVRALAIALVVGGHMLSHNLHPALILLFGGQDGVGLFFVLSGFLVTTLLLREHAASGSIHISHFYFRRAMRIVPPLLGYLLVVMCIAWWQGDPLPGRVICSVLLFYHNMAQEGSWMLEHTWSLAVEEQFYLLWPPLVVLLLRVSWRTLVYTSCALIVGAPFFRLGGHMMHWEWMHHKESYLLPTRMDALLAGSMVACLAGTPRFERAYQQLARFHLLAPVFLFCLSPYLTRRFWLAYPYSIGLTLNALVGAFFILWLSRNETHLLGRIANWKPIAQIGVMSYSVYLWQTLGSHYSDGALKASLGLLFIAAMTALSFWLIEQPSAHARRHLGKILFKNRARTSAAVQNAAAA